MLIHQPDVSFIPVAPFVALFREIYIFLSFALVISLEGLANLSVSFALGQAGMAAPPGADQRDNAYVQSALPCAGLREES